MSGWVAGTRCRVRVPATSANLGPGFDSLGLALGIYDVVEAEVTSAGLDVQVEGEGGQALPRDEAHLVVRAIRAGFARWALAGPPGLTLVAHNAIPHGRGLGSSAAAVVAGLVLADRLATSAYGPDPERDVLALAASLEGHPDNAAAALLGGLTIAWLPSDSGPARAVRVDPHPSIEPVLLVPDHQLETRHARSVLPDLVPHADAARGAGRVALLVHALTVAPEHLLPATQDWLHQQQRRVAMPETIDLVGELRADGHAAVVSGAGPSVLVLAVGDRDGGLGEQAGDLVGHPPAGWRAIAPGIAYQGTRAGVLRSGSLGGATVLH